MSSIKHDNDADLVGFMAGWDKRLGENVQLPVGFAVLALTNFGERPVPSVRLARVLGRPVSEVEALAQAPSAAGVRPAGEDSAQGGRRHRVRAVPLLFLR